ncbi:MAG: PEP/pyruvate-binding domain-containing protein, partial [Thermodesulfobacteriota bacterium]
NYITMRDIYEILQRTVWNPERSGRIGGKAAGLILAHRILLPLYKETRPEFAHNIRVPDSYFIRSEILSEFLQKNNLEKYHSQKYQTLETIERDYPKIREEFERARFPEDTIQGFRYILERVGEHPVILRSSSFLEDNFGLAFSGKYESIFLANQGDFEDRLREFIHAVKMVHLSTYHPDPIRYRADHNLLDFNEHMSVLVQKVVGRRFGDYFFPFAGGVVFSHNSFVWDPKIDREAGLMRLVLGLGTRAVDRVGGDYPRMVPLSHPTLRPEADAKAIRKYSQRKVDVLHLKTNRIVSLNLADLLREIRHPEMHLAVSVAEGDHLQNLVSRLSDFDPASASLTFDRMLKETGFPFLIREMVQTLSQAYGWPVDVEFAYDDGKIYLL